MIDWERGGYSTRWRYVRVDHATRSEVGEMAYVTGCRISESMLTDLKVTGTLDYAVMPDVGDDLVRIYSDSAIGAASETVCHATLFLSTPSAAMSCMADGGAMTSEGSGSMYSVLLALKDAQLAHTETAAAGSNAVSEAARLASSCGVPVVATPSSRTLSTGHVWEAGTTALEAVNDLLDAAGYGSAGVDAYGNVVMRPYQDPASKAPACTLADHGESVAAPAYEHELDSYGVPNKVIVVCSNSDEPPIVGVATNDDPESRWSVAARGREVCRTERVSDIGDQAAADAKACALLMESTRLVESVVVEHAWMPFEVGDAVTVDFARSGTSGKMTAVSREVESTANVLCKTRLRRTVSIW